MKNLLACLLLLGLFGCGGTDESVQNTPVTPLPDSLTQSVDSDQGALLNLSTHTMEIPPGSISQDSLVQLSTSPAPSAQPPDESFEAVGSQLLVDLGPVDHDGIRVTLPPPPPTDRPVFVVMQVDGIFVPIESERLPDGSYRATLEINATEFELGYVLGQDFPPHVTWGSYNGYVYDSKTGKFTQFLHQGKVTTQVPSLGNRPMMVVHGLGSSISNQGFAPMAKFLLEQGSVTGVVGFEYDTLDTISNNGKFLAAFFTELSANNPNKTWRHLGHSMGGLVSREAFEKGTLPIAAQNNMAVLLCSPHLGSHAINLLQGNLTDEQKIVANLVMNNYMEFNNVDGKKCQVKATDPGFDDLKDGSTALAALNKDAAKHHPQHSYYTIAGNKRDFKFDYLDQVMKENFDDGLVNVVSANFELGQLAKETAPTNHTDAVSDTTTVFPLVRGFFTTPTP